MPLSEEEWEALAAPALDGDRAATEAVFAEAARFARWCAIRVAAARGIRVDLDNVVGDATLNVFRYMGRFDATRGTFKNFILERARQGVSVSLRRGGITEASVDAMSEVNYEPAARDIQSDRTEVDEEVRRVLVALDGLPEYHRDTIVRTYGLDGLPPESLRQIAKRYRISYQAVQLRIKHAHKKLRHALLAEDVERSTEG